MAAQAQRFSFAELTRAADVTAAALNELKGATSPRLQLEILVARLMLTAADSSDLGIVARLAQVERLAAAGAFAGPIPTVAAAPAESAAPAVPAESAAAAAPVVPVVPAASGGQAAQDSVAPAAADAGHSPVPESPAATDSSAATADQLPGPEAAPSAGAGGTQLQRVRVLWADVLEAVKNRSRVSWMMLFEKAQVLDLDGSTLTLALGKPGDVKAFNDGGHGERVRQALIDVAGMDLTVQAVLNPSAAATGAAPRSGVGSGGRGSGAAASPAAEPPAGPGTASTGAAAPAGSAGGAGSAAPGRAALDDADHGDVPDPDDEVESTDPAAVLRALGATPISD
jgi:DNA polymerase-3 subunit gamma/tau